MDTATVIRLLWVTLMILLPGCTPLNPAAANPTSTLAPTPIPPTPTPLLPTLTVPIPTATPVQYPAARGCHGMAYDTESGRVIMYGGITGTAIELNNQNHETWSYDSARQLWTRMSPPVSPDGYFAELVYDSKADRVILVTPAEASSFSNFDFKRMHTWAYDFNTDTWVRRADGPFGRFGTRLAYDSKAGKLLLFGGVTPTGQGYLNDTWAYDYATDRWTELKPPVSPEPRSFHGMAYSTVADKTMVWGGDVNGASKLNLPRILWLYDYSTNTWTDFKYESGPIGLTAWRLVYDERADVFITFGGIPPNLGFTWSYDLKTNTWLRLEPAQNPGPLTVHSMVYANNEDRSFLFGGQQGSMPDNYISNTWVFDLKDNTWTNLSP